MNLNFVTTYRHRIPDNLQDEFIVGRVDLGVHDVAVGSFELCSVVLAVNGLVAPLVLVADVVGLPFVLVIVV